MKSVLIISYEFPPKGGSGVQRVTKFAKYLPEYGWSPTVLTVKDMPTILYDENLAKETEGMDVERVYSLEPTRLWVWLSKIRSRLRPSSPDSSTQAGKRSLTGLPSWLIRFIQAFFVPDEKIGWLPWAVREGVRIAKKEKVQLILASGPPFTGYLVAKKVSRRTGIPWVADFRDPWVGHYYLKPQTSVHGWLTERLEASVIRDADAVVSVAPQTTYDFVERYPAEKDKFTTIMNGYDSNDFPAQPRASQKFLVAYMGSFYEQRNPRVFLRAVSELMAEEPGFADDLAIKFIGATDPLTLRLIEESAAREKVELTGYRPHEECLEMFLEARVLLFITDPQESQLHLAGKIFEYLAAGRPILALTGPGTAGELVRQTNTGQVVDPGDTGAVKEALVGLYRDFQAGVDSHRPNREELLKHERKTQTGELAKVFEKVMRLH